MAQVLTDFEKENVDVSSLCQLPASVNRLILEFTDSRLVHVLYHSWALPTLVNGRPTILANTSTQNSKFFGPFSLFYDSSTKELWKAPCAQKPLTPFRDWLKLINKQKLLRSGRSARSELVRVEVAQVLTDFEKEMWCSSLCQLPASENRLTLEFTNSRLVHVLYYSWALPTSVNGRPTTFANTSTQNSKFFSPFSLFYDTSTKKALKKAPCVRQPLTLFWDWLKLVTSKSFTKWEVCTFRIGASRCGAVMTDFEKEMWRSSICQLPAFETGWPSNSQIAVWFTFCTTLELFQHRWMTSYDLRKYIDTNIQVFQSIFVVFRHVDKKALKKHLAFKKKNSHRPGIGLNL